MKRGLAKLNMNRLIFFSGRKIGGGGRSQFYFLYMTDKSRVSRDSLLLKSPFRLKPGAWVELRTCFFLFI